MTEPSETKFLENYTPTPINERFGKFVPLAKKANIRTFALEFVETRNLTIDQKSLFVYETVLANSSAQVALARAEHVKIAMLSDMIEFIRATFTVYLQEQNSQTAFSPIKPMMRPDETIRTLCEFVMAILPNVKNAHEELSSLALWYLHCEEFAEDHKGVLNLEQINEQFLAFDRAIVPVAVQYLEKFYPEKLQAYYRYYQEGKNNV